MTLMLNIKDMTGTNRLFNFLKGTKSKSWGFKTRADRPTNLGKEPNDGGSWNDQSPRINSMIMIEPKQSKCYLCDGPHRFTDCPHKGALNVLRAIREEEKGLKGKEQREDDSTPLMIGAICFLGALEKQKHKPSTEKGLIYIDLWINGKAARALVDTGATNNFIADMAPLQFHLNMQEDTGKIKVVNSKATNIVGVAHRVLCQMGSWNGEIDFTVIPLDDFDVVIGMEFLKKARAIPFQ
ncbi:hypothetical protein GH714_035831 [Hevea brasiliensis]|uniref:Aspartic peptidase DDI1-type domain-containing protein n=1 Tax=Hevea brasiliensis TaxID=3981 RepID=A0A6A6NDY4_HEVBR|nr:hypothetical protein GH714_035831 [Hevea brasiliensis]